MRPSSDAQTLAQNILAAYRIGIFPMAMAADDPEVYWFRPELRGVMPIKGFHASRSLHRDAHRFAKTTSYCLNGNFERVIDACADRDETWINPTIRDAFVILHNEGHAHSIEVIRNDILIGGVYGLAIGGAFMGESMFSRAPNGSKLALWSLVSHLDKLGFTLFDTQYLTEHLASLGGIEISDQDYAAQLEQAVNLKPDKILAGKIAPPLGIIGS